MDPEFLPSLTTRPDKRYVDAYLSSSSAEASLPPPVKRDLTFKEEKERTAKSKAGLYHVKATAKATERAALRAAKKHAASLSSPKETEAHRKVRHEPGMHHELFHESEHSYEEKYDGSPREEGEVPQPPQQKGITNPLDEHQETTCLFFNLISLRCGRPHLGTLYSTRTAGSLEEMDIHVLDEAEAMPSAEGNELPGCVPDLMHGYLPVVSYSKLHEGFSTNEQIKKRAKNATGVIPSSWVHYWRTYVCTNGEKYVPRGKDMRKHMLTRKTERSAKMNCTVSWGGNDVDRYLPVLSKGVRSHTTTKNLWIEYAENRKIRDPAIMGRVQRRMRREVTRMGSWR
ncbi:hypothetical protein BBJ28_00019212 [Nothophytophthora sp. Chile5]|nr:hypothetical protein BBJ28_00019212 [Nothophytophthora sp. Chile5]